MPQFDLQKTAAAFLANVPRLDEEMGQECDDDEAAEGQEDGEDVFEAYVGDLQDLVTEAGIENAEEFVEDCAIALAEQGFPLFPVESATPEQAAAWVKQAVEGDFHNRVLAAAHAQVASRG